MGTAYCTLCLAKRAQYYATQVCMLEHYAYVCLALADTRRLVPVNTRFFPHLHRGPKDCEHGGNERAHTRRSSIHCGHHATATILT